MLEGRRRYLPRTRNVTFQQRLPRYIGKSARPPAAVLRRADGGRKGEAYGTENRQVLCESYVGPCESYVNPM